MKPIQLALFLIVISSFTTNCSSLSGTREPQNFGTLGPPPPVFEWEVEVPIDNGTQTTTAPKPSTSNNVKSAKKGDFVSRYKRLSPAGPYNRNGRKIYQMPMGGNSKTIGPCGSKHIRDYRSKPHMTPIAACMFTAIAQEWRKRHCPSNAPDCQILFGNSTFGKSKPSSWPHSTHRNGDCADIWPIRKPGHSGETRVGQSSYDSARTVQLAMLISKMGAETTKSHRGAHFFFNSPKVYKNKSIGARYLKNHYDHLHICFRNNSANRKRCNNFKLDTKICPTLR